MSDWVNLTSYAKRHERSDSSHQRCQISAESFLSIFCEKTKNSVIEFVSKTHKEQIMQNKHVLEKIIEVFILCGKQNIAIRGHTEQRSNFMAILNFKAQDDEILRDHLNNPNIITKNTSPDIQNELLNICYDQLREEIVRDCNKASCFTLLADECSDKSPKEQVTVCLRFLDSLEGKSILCFVEAESTTGESISELLLEALDSAGVNIDKMRGQGYDGTANMSGMFNGVQARIKERVPTASYVHCKSHQLNLAIVHSSNIPIVRTMMGTVQDIGFAFSLCRMR